MAQAACAEVLPLEEGAKRAGFQRYARRSPVRREKRTGALRLSGCHIGPAPSAHLNPAWVQRGLVPPARLSYPSFVLTIGGVAVRDLSLSHRTAGRQKRIGIAGGWL